MDAFDVAPPEVERDTDGDHGGDVVGRLFGRLPRMAEISDRLREQADDILTGSNT